MKKVFIQNNEAGSRESEEPRLLGSIVSEMLHGHSPLAVGYRQYIASQENGEAEAQGWHTNTDFGCDVKTFLRSDRRMVVGKEYQGIFRCDSDATVEEFRSRDPHYTLVEAKTMWIGKRNLHVFDGKYISVTRQDNGGLRLNFKKLEIGENFSVEKYALGVFNEICMALEGLVEEGPMEAESK